MRPWTAIALAVGLGWGCDNTPDPSPVPSPSATTSGGIPIVIVPVGRTSPVPVPRPVPSTPGATFAVVLATPPASSTINLTGGDTAKIYRPTLDFEFRYPQNLTLDDDFTNIEIMLLSGTGITNLECHGQYCGPTVPSSYTTNRILFRLTPDVANPNELRTSVPMGWTFVVR
jgi:hypothetical protein